MRILFDQNISHRILNLISKKYPDATSLKSKGLIDATDLEIWKFAKENGYTIVTQDSDFNELNSLYGFPPKIIWIRAGNLKTQSVADLVVNYFEQIERFVDDADFGCFEIFKLKP